jgi:hypothetical protein
LIDKVSSFHVNLFDLLSEALAYLLPHDLERTSHQLGGCGWMWVGVDGCEWVDVFGIICLLCCLFSLVDFSFLITSLILSFNVHTVAPTSAHTHPQPPKKHAQFETKNRTNLVLHGKGLSREEHGAWCAVGEARRVGCLERVENGLCQLLCIVVTV